jgi:hypothetical protein
MSDLGTVISKICQRRDSPRADLPDFAANSPLAPLWERWLAQCLSYPMVTGLVAMAVLGVLGMFFFAAQWGLTSPPAAAPPAAVGVAIPTGTLAGGSGASFPPATAIGVSESREAEHTGTLSGVVSYLGPHPARTMLPAPTGTGRSVIDESLIVDETSAGLANAFVYLEKLPAGVTIPPPSASEIDATIFGARLIPHAILVRTGQHLIITNNDNAEVRAHAMTILNTRTASRIRPEALTLFRFSMAERNPVPLVYRSDGMKPGYLLIVDHPWAAITDRNGKFTIADLPVGTHRFRIWHEVPGHLTSGLTVEIEADKPAHVELSIPAATFGR